MRHANKRLKKSKTKKKKIWLGSRATNPRRSKKFTHNQESIWKKNNNFLFFCDVCRRGDIISSSSLDNLYTLDGEVPLVLHNSTILAFSFVWHCGWRHLNAEFLHQFFSLSHVNDLMILNLAKWIFYKKKRMRRKRWPPTHSINKSLSYYNPLEVN